MAQEDLNIIWCEMGSQFNWQRWKEGAEGRQTSEPEKAHPTCGFVIVAKFGDHVLRCLALKPFECDQAGRQADKNSSLGDFFRIQYFAFSCYFVVLTAIFGFGSAKTILWACFSLRKNGSFYERQLLGRASLLTKQVLFDKQENSMKSV